jgi:hypothetical protein
MTEPRAHLDHAQLGDLSRLLIPAEPETPAVPAFVPRGQPAPRLSWGDDLGEDAVRQMAAAASLPVAVAGALMPDAHVGYGLPIARAEPPPRDRHFSARLPGLALTAGIVLALVGVPGGEWITAASAAGAIGTFGWSVAWARADAGRTFPQEPTPASGSS